MWLPKEEKKGGGKKKGLVGVAIDKDKGSQYALKWAIENLLLRGQTVVLIHVIPKQHMSSGVPSPPKEVDKQAKDLFLTFHCFCARKDVQCIDVILEDKNVVKALVEYVSHAAIENLVLGASRHGFIRKLKGSDIPSYVSKGAPDFCTVYVISKGKISSVRNASRSAPFTSPLQDKISENNSRVSHSQASSVRSKSSFCIRGALASSSPSPSITPDRTPNKLRYLSDDTESIKSPFARKRGHGSDRRLFGDLSESETDLSFVSSSGDRPSSDRCSVSLYNYNNGRMSTCSSSENSLGSLRFGAMYSDNTSSLNDFSSSCLGSAANSSSSQDQLQDEVESEMRRLKVELKQTMDLYSTACREALTAKQKAVELHHWRQEEERRLEEAQLAEEAALAIAEREKAKCRAAIEAAEAAQRIAQLEAQRRISAEMKILREAQETDDLVVHRLVPNENMYRKYSIEEIEIATDYFSESRKIGEGGYGPVYRCYLDHTPVAVKVLRPDAAQGREQFQREVEILSCMRHPNMVLLLGACPEYGCLVYEYMGNGSLDDRIFRKDNTAPLSWQLRFRIAAEIGTGLLFLHQTKPEPLVHRDLKPANILVDHNYVSKISDVGLARLVPPSLADGVTQLRMTSTAGTFCYIDPEYQQTGMLGVKSDIYSLGILLLQLITAKPAMALAYHVGRSIEKGRDAFAQMLDQTVFDWPMDDVLCLAKIGVQCAELRRKDRPDLGKEVMPELNRLKQLALDHMNNHFTLEDTPTHVSITQDVMSDPLLESCESSKSHSGSSAND